jgi:predicted ATPase
VKEIAQIGAAIGREFSYTLLRTVVALDEAALKAALIQLEEAELLFRRGDPPEASYVFKHALVRDAAYESLLKSRRQVLHGRIAEALRDRFPAQAEAEPEVVAHHFTQAGLKEPAIEWWGKAGDRALRRSAFKEAIAHLGKAIEMAEGMADEPARRLTRLRLQIAYGNALIAARGYGALETTAAFARARELAAGIEDAIERFSTYYGLWVGSFVRGELTPMREIAEGFLRDAERQPGSPEAGIAHRAFGCTCWFQGDYVGAREHLEKALAAYEPVRDRGLAFRFGQGVGVSAMIFLDLVLWPLGEVDRARRLAEEALLQARETGHVPTIIYGLFFMSVFEALRRDAKGATPYAETVVSLSREHGLPLWLAAGTLVLGWARWHAGDREAGMAGMREGLALCHEKELRLTLPLLEAMLAEAGAEEGRVEAALTTLDDTLAEAERTGQRWLDAELHRLRGELLLRREPPDAAGAEAAFLRAIEVASGQKTRSFELRAGLSLARLYHATGRNEAARALLAPALVGFAEGPELPEVAEATRLLASLA